MEKENANTKPTCGEHAKKKKVTTGTLKKKAWKYFSIFIRTRDCIATTGDHEYGICVTCGKRFHFKELQAGHYVSGRNNAVLFHEDLVRAQCMRCNVWLEGNKTKYALYMFKHYTPEQMEGFEMLRNQTVKRTVGDYEVMIEDFKQRTKALSGLCPAPGRKKASD